MTSDHKMISVMDLPPLPPDWLKRDDVVRLIGFDWLYPKSNTHDEVWGVAFLKADKHFIAYRYHKYDQFAYGG